MHTHQKSSDPVATIGLDIGKNTFHLVGLDNRGAIAMRIKVSRNQLIRRLVNLPPCLIGTDRPFTALRRFRARSEVFAPWRGQRAHALWTPNGHSMSATGRRWRQWPALMRRASANFGRECSGYIAFWDPDSNRLLCLRLRGKCYLYHLDAMQQVSFPDINKSPTKQGFAPPCKNTPIPGVPEVVVPITCSGSYPSFGPLAAPA
jgi:hypothetical protein